MLREAIDIENGAVRGHHGLTRAMPLRDWSQKTDNLEARKGPIPVAVCEYDAILAGVAGFLPVHPHQPSVQEALAHSAQPNCCSADMSKLTVLVCLN